MAGTRSPPEGRATAIETIHAALDAGINYIDTAPGYGNGNSESIIGEAVQARRDRTLGGVLNSHAGWPHCPSAGRRKPPPGAGRGGDRGRTMRSCAGSRRPSEN